MGAPKDPTKYEEWKKKISAASKKQHEDPLCRKQASEKTKIYFENHPEAKEAQSNRMKKYFESDDAKRKHSEAQKKRFEDPEERLRASEAHKKTWENPTYRKKAIENLKTSTSTPEAIQKRVLTRKKTLENNPDIAVKTKSAIKEYWDNTPNARETFGSIQRLVKNTTESKENMRNKMLQYSIDHPDKVALRIEKIKKYWDTHPEAKIKQSVVCKGAWDNQELKRAHGEKTKTRLSDPIVKSKMLDNRKKSYDNNPEIKKKMSASQKNRFSNMDERKKYSTMKIQLYEDMRWYGSVTYNDKPQYCVKFRIVKPKVRAFFEYRCVECNKVENGQSHHVHHVFYDKQSCCLEESTDGLYYSNLHVRGHNAKDYCIGNNPNYFVLLCGSCHMKTNGKFERRVKWADYFKDLIDTKYGGVCWKEPETETLKSQEVQ